MRSLKGRSRCARKSAFTIAMMVTNFALAATLGFAATPIPDTIHATYSQAGNAVGITLIIYNYSTPSDLQSLSQAFQQGHDQELATALSKTKAVGRCIVAGEFSYDVAFIQMVRTPTGRQIVFITSRPNPFDEAEPTATSRSFDLAVGQFDLNDTDPSKSTGFLFPASKLVADEQGTSHYDLTGASWELVNILYSSGSPPSTTPHVADASGPDHRSDQASSSVR